MTKQTINTSYPENLISVGATANDRSGDPLRTAFTKVNDAFDKIDANFTELYAQQAGEATNKLINGNKELVLNVDGDRAWVDFPAAFGDSITVQGAEIGTITSSIVISGSENVMVSANVMADARKDWTFDGAGTLTMPGGIASTGDMTFTAGNNLITLDTAGQITTEHAIKWQEGGAERAAISYNPFTDGFVIGTNTSGITKAWKFGDNGNLTLPAGGDIVDSNGDSVLSGSAGTGVLQLQTPPEFNYGAEGDTKGMIAMDDVGAFYYCFKNYTDGQSAIWSKILGNFGW